MLAVIALLFVVLPIVEITVAIQVAHHIGGLNTVALLLLFSFAGVWLARLEGFSVLRRIQEQLENRTVPTNELIEGALVFVGGLLLVVPGFVTDALGLLLLCSRSAGTWPAASQAPIRRARPPHRTRATPTASSTCERSAPRAQSRGRRSSGTTGQSLRAAASDARCTPRGPAMQSTRAIESSSTGASSSGDADVSAAARTMS